MELLDKIKTNARNNIQRIVLPESHDERTLRAADTAIHENLAQIILIGNREHILKDAVIYGLKEIEKATLNLVPYSFIICLMALFASR